MNIKVKKLHEKAELPTTGSDKATGYDVRACLVSEHGEEMSVVIHPHETVVIGTGLCMAPPHGYWIGVYARSGLSTKEGLRPANCVGVCDEDYRGEYKVALHNDSDVMRTVNHGDRIAQIVLQERLDMDFTVVDDLDETERGSGGFGSTGTN